MTIAVILIILLLPQSLFCAREQKRVHPDEPFWNWRDWIPFVGMIRLQLRTGHGIGYLVGCLMLGLGTLAGFTIPSTVGSAGGFAAGILGYIICGMVFLIPYINKLTPNLSDRVFLSMVSPIGLLYYAAFISSYKEDRVGLYGKLKNMAKQVKEERAKAKAEEEAEEMSDVDEEETEEDIKETAALGAAEAVVEASGVDEGE